MSVSFYFFGREKLFTVGSSSWSIQSASVIENEEHVFK